MIRAIAGSLLFLFLVAIQTSFIHSLPGVLSLVPFMFAVCVYLIQHHSFALGAIWLVLFGIFNDLFHIGSVPLETLAYTISAGVALISSRHVFSNRSMYGVLGCGTISYVSLEATRLIIQFFQNLQGAKQLILTSFWTQVLWGWIGCLIILIILFQFAGKIRTILIKSFLLSLRHETF